MRAAPIYLDYHSHAPIDARVLPVLSHAYSELDGNPHSNHAYGEHAASGVSRARGEVADLVGDDAAEVVFVSGATEANNLVFKGLAQALIGNGRDRVLVGAGEHASVLAAAESTPGLRVERVPLLSSGRIDLRRLTAMLDRGVGLVSIAAANHEIGTIQDVAAIATLTSEAGALFHSDLAQAAGRVPLPACFDLASLSSHKIGGPIGIGALLVRRRVRRAIRPLLVGGGQEAGLRAGTVPAPLCVAFGHACTLARAERDEEARRVQALRDRLRDRLAAAGSMREHGDPEHRLPGNLNVGFDGVDGEALVMRLRNEVSISTGSACSSTSVEPSHVLIAIGLEQPVAEQAVRFGLGRTTSADDVSAAADAVLRAVAELRSVARRVA